MFKGLCLFFIISVTANAAYLPQANCLHVGGRDFCDADTNSSFKILMTYNDVASRASGFVNGAGTAYQVPSGKTFQVKAWRMSIGQYSAFARATLLYSDNAIGFNSATTGTNPIFIGGFANTIFIMTSATDSASARPPVVGPAVSEGVTDFSIPAQKYINALFDTGTSNMVQIFGYEQ